MNMALPVNSSRLYRESWGLAMLALVLFIAGVYQQTVTGFDSRFVLFAKEMLRHGPGFFPTTYGEPYPDYSSFTTLLTYWLSVPFGRVISLTAWLPTAAASAAIVLLMYRLVAPYSRQWALLSIALLLLSNTFITETRAVSLDQMLAAVSLAVFYLAYAHDHFSAPRRSAWLFVLLALGFAVRGPMGLVIPTGMLCVYYLFCGQWRRMLGVGFGALLLLAGCIGLLLWLAKLSGGNVFVDEVIRMQFLGRMDGSAGSSGVLHYFSSSMGNYALAYPLALLTGLCLLLERPRATPALRLLGFCALAALVVIVGLSVPQAKKARYLLPMLPMVAIIAAYPFYSTQGRLLRAMRWLIQGVWLLLPGLLMVGLLVLKRKFPVELDVVGPMLVLLGALQIAAMVFLIQDKARVLGLAFTAVFAVWASYIGVYERVERQLYDTRQFSLAVDHQVGSDTAPLVLYGMGKDAKAIKFMVNLDRDLHPLFVNKPQALEQLARPFWLMIEQPDWQTIKDAAKGSALAQATPALEGRFDKSDYLLLYVPL